jgi:hypothetical protein
MMEPSWKLLPLVRDSCRFALLWSLVLCGIVGCATLRPQGKSLVPTRYQTRTGPYAVFTNGPLDADHPAIRNLASLQQELERSLGWRVDPEQAPIEVYILDDGEAFSHFLSFHYPDLPPRRAFFLAQGDRRVVYTFNSDRLEEDLRHEAAHALLHAGVADLPLWLDEGLAEYFEVPEQRDGLNEEHLRRLPRDLAEGWQPDLKRLESLAEVRSMTPRDYRESWLWVHYLLHGPRRDRADLLAYLADLHENPDAAPLSARLEDRRQTRDARLLAHLTEVQDGAMAALSRPPDPGVTRFQDDGVERASLPVRPAPARRGFFRRVLSTFGL